MKLYNTIILGYVTFGYFFAFFMYLLMLVMKREIFGKIGSLISIITLLFHTFGIILRWIESYRLGIGHAPLSNLYESLIFFGWAIMLMYVILEWKTKIKMFGAFVTPIAFLIMAYASFSPSVNDRIQPLIPALKSNWLIAHVVTCFMGYAAFGISMALSIIYLLNRRSRIADILEELNYQIIIIGFFMLSLGIITGSVWAHYAWGSYWSWDPKETWSLITWLIYAALIHSRHVRGWRGKRIAILSIIGFCCVLFTYLGVNFLLSGLHSYATKS